MGAERKPDNTPVRYESVCLKLSGEVFGGAPGFGFDHGVIGGLAEQVRRLMALGIRTGVVVGGGNIFRGGRSAPPGMDRVVGDHMGMLSTVINALYLQDAMERAGVETRVLTAIEIRSIAEPYIKRRMIRHLEKGRAVIFAAGTGNPFFTTDTAAALRASEMGADVLIKGTKVDGVYDKDPVKHADAVRFESLGYPEVLARDLNVMDATAVAFCKENRMPILVLDIANPDGLYRAVTQGGVGTLVS